MGRLSNTKRFRGGESLYLVTKYKMNNTSRVVQLFNFILLSLIGILTKIV
jgi:hypothetical protein